VKQCDLIHEQWANFAGDSVIVLLTTAGDIAVVAPAVATGVTVAAGTVAATYGRIKGYCQLQERA
jgi:hypothetical protein